MDDSRDQRALRASDADRERVADLLREAASDGRLSLTELEERIDALYAAKTYGELEPVMHDLPGIGLPQPQATAPAERTDAAAPAKRIGGRPGATATKAIFGGAQRRGDWVVPRHYRVKAVFGGVDLDLREATLETDEVEIAVKAVFGGVTIVVPPDIRVTVDGDGVFGAFADQVSTSQPAGAAPIVHVTGKAVFGGVNVERKAVGEK